MQVYAGTYGTGTLPENALNTALLQSPEIASALISLYPRYAMTYLLEKTGRYAAEKIIGDKTYEWKVLGRSNRATLAVAADSSTSDVSTVGGAVEVGCATEYLNINDVIRFQSGATALVTAAYSSTNSSYAAKLISGTVDVSADLADNAIINTIGSAFPDGSAGSDVGSFHVLPETHRNYLSVMRKKIEISAKDMTDVTWIENNGHKVWFFTQEQLLMNEFLYQQELQRWYGATTVSAHTGVGGTAPTVTSGLNLMGDGILAQIDSANADTYDAFAGLSEDDIIDFIGKLSRNAQSAEGNEWCVFTGTDGMVQFTKAMKDFLKDGGSAAVMADKKGKDISIGGNFREFYCLGNKIVLAHCPVFDDPNLHASTSDESGKMVFIDFSQQGGQANVEIVAKGAEGQKRTLVKKYITGMVDPFNPKSAVASNGDDKFECQVLSETGIILRNPLSCGILSVA